MEDSIFFVNNIIENVDIQKTERIVWLDSKYSYCYTIEMIPDKTNINKRYIKTLEEELANGVIKKYGDKRQGFPKDRSISEKEKEIMEKARKAINYIFDAGNEPEIYSDCHIRAKILNTAFKECNLAKSKIYEYFRLYLQGGKSINAITPNYFNSGGKGKQKKSGKKKRGRSNFKSNVQKDIEGVNVDDEIKNIIRKSVDKYYMNENETPLSYVYGLMNQEYFTETIIENGEAVKKVKPSHKIITEQQFRYWCKVLEDVAEMIRKRKGYSDFNNNCKAITTDSRFDAFGSGYYAQADASPFKVEIVNRMRSKTISKPTAYHISDVFSTLIIGLSVVIGKPSWDGLSSAILNIREDKVKYCAKFGLTIDESQWPTTMLMGVLVTDRGAEFSGKLLNPLVENIGVSIRTSEARMPRNKGVVEQSFNIPAIKMRTWFTGTSKNKFRQRGDKDPKDYAQLDILDATYAELCLAVWLNNRTIPDHPYAGELMKEGIIPTPVNIYKWGLKRFAGGIVDYDPDYVKYCLLRRGTATITERGIKFRLWYYDCDKAQAEGWYTKARIGKSWVVDIAYDQRDMSNIYIMGEQNETPIACTMKPECYFFKGKSLGEIEDFLNQKTIDETSTYIDHDNQNDLWLYNELKDVKKSAERKMGGTKKNSSDMKKDITESQKAEKNSYSKHQAIKAENDFDSAIYEQESVDMPGTSEDSMFSDINNIRKRKR